MLRSGTPRHLARGAKCFARSDHGGGQSLRRASALFSIVHRGVEGRQVVAEAVELGAQRRHAALVGGDGDEARVVELAGRRLAAGGQRLAQGGRIRRPSARASASAIERLRVNARRAASARSTMSSAPSCCRLRSGTNFSSVAGRALVRNQRRSPSVSTTRREGLVEVAVAGRVHGLVREFVEDEGRELRVAVAEHRVQHRVAQVAERRIGDRGPDVDVVAARAELVRLAGRARARRNSRGSSRSRPRESTSASARPRAPARRTGSRSRSGGRGRRTCGSCRCPAARARRSRSRAPGRRARAGAAASRRSSGRAITSSIGSRLRVHLELARGEVRVVAAAEQRHGRPPRPRAAGPGATGNRVT